MSHILRNRLGPGKRPTQGGTVVPRRMNGDGNKKSQRSQVQQQVLVQRRTTTQEYVQVQPQTITTVQPGESRLLQEAMAEVLVLEELQRESQRRLANANSVKQRHLDQRAMFETELTLLKYSNGENRAQIIRSRELLSSSHRELTALQTASDRNGDSIRRMEVKLSKGLDARRLTLILHRQVELRLQSLVQNENRVDHWHAKALEKLEATERSCQELEQRQKFVTKARQEEMARIQKFADMTANARTEGLRLEQDLTSARQFDSSARLRNENLAKEQVNEETRSSAAVAKISDRLGDCESKMASLRNKQSNFQKEVDGKQEMLRGLRQRLFEFHSLQNCPSSHELGSVSADSVWEKLQRAVAREQDAVNDQIAAKHRVEAALESAVHDKAKKEEDIVRVNENCQTISKRLHEGKEIEAERRASSEMALGKLTKLREEVDFLHTTLGQLQKTKEQEIADGTRFIDEQSRLRQKRQDDLDHMRQELETENSQLDDLKKSNHDMDNLNRERIENAKGVLDAAQKSAEQLRGHGEQLASEEAYEAEIQGEIESIKTARAFLVRDVEAEIAHIRKKYAPLRDVVFSADASKSTKQLAKEVFHKAFAKCNEVLKQARKLRDEAKSSTTTTHARSDGWKSQKNSHHTREVLSDVHHGSNSSRKVTFLGGDAPPETVEPRSKRESQTVDEMVRGSSTRPKTDIVEIQSDNSNSSPIAKTGFNFVTHSVFPEHESETKPRDLLPVFTQASLEEDSVASAQEARRVRWDLQEKKSSTRDDNVDDVLGPKGSRFGRKYGATTFGNGAILRHKQRPSVVSYKSSPDEQDNQEPQLSHVTSNARKETTRSERTSFEIDDSLVMNKNSLLDGASRDKTSASVDVAPERKKSQASTHNVADNISRSKREQASCGSQAKSTKREQSAVAREGSAKKQKVDHSSKLNTNRSVNPKDSKPSRVVHEDAHRGTGRRHSKGEKSVVVESRMNKRKAEPLDKMIPKHSRTTGVGILARGNKIEKSQQPPQATSSKSTISKSSAKGKREIPRAAGKVHLPTGSTQASGISSMERAPPKRPKKRVGASKISRGLAPLDDIDEYNFHPQKK